MGIILIDIDIYKDLHKRYVRECRRTVELSRIIDRLRERIANMEKSTPKPKPSPYYDWDDMFGGLFK